MPVALLRIKEGRLPDGVVAQISSRLPAVIAAALDCQESTDARLTAQDIETWVQFTTPFDANVKDLRVLVFAHKFQFRFDNVEERKEKILAGLRAILRDFDFDIEGWVWLHLTDTAFGPI